MSDPTPSQGEIEAAVRRYLVRMAARYLPVLAAAVALVAVVTLTPTTSPAAQSQAIDFGNQDTGGGDASGTGDLVDQGSTPGSTTAGTSGGSTSTSGAASSTTGAVNGTSGTSGTTTGSTSGPKTSGAAAGVSRGGVTCTQGAKQVPWTSYAPPCVPAYSGSNGGKTSAGVTSTSITLAYRLGNSASDAAIGAATGAAAPPNDADYLKDLQAYVDYFNKQFELYGRKVVLKSYQGQGDYINEDQGQGADRAQADAATAKGLGAFGDVTFQLRGSNPYWSALAQQKVVAWGPLGFPDSYYQKKAPFWWSVTPSGTDQAKWMGNMTCRRLGGMKAIFSPDPTISGKQRAFGLIHPENPEYTTIASEMKSVLSGCGVKVTREATYSINVAQFQTQAQNVMAQMKAAGVTTVLCYCDPVVPIFLGNASQSQNYKPEWVQPYWGDGQAQQIQGGKWQGVMVPGATWPAEQANEAYQVFKRATGGRSPAERYYAAAYGTAIQVFMALQAAGPTLTPNNLARGAFSLPAMHGFAGTWRYQGGAHAYTPVDDSPVAWYDPTYTSRFNQTKGGYRTCESGKAFTFDQASAWGGPRVQLHCFGK